LHVIGASSPQGSATQVMMAADLLYARREYPYLSEGQALLRLRQELEERAWEIATAL
jgi:hypothetical protein